jgi:hypothetical protein
LLFFCGLFNDPFLGVFFFATTGRREKELGGSVVRDFVVANLFPSCFNLCVE